MHSEEENERNNVPGKMDGLTGDGGPDMADLQEKSSQQGKMDGLTGDGGPDMADVQEKSSQQGKIDDLAGDGGPDMADVQEKSSQQGKIDDLAGDGGPDMADVQEKSSQQGKMDDLAGDGGPDMADVQEKSSQQGKMDDLAGDGGPDMADLQDNSSQQGTQGQNVSLECYQLLRVLGEGAYGKVFLSGKKDGKKDTERFYAIKVIKKGVMKTNHGFAHTQTENRVLRSTNHPFLTSLKYSFQTNDRLYFVLEYASGGGLFLHLFMATKVSEKTMKFYIAEIICAIAYLHAQNIIYRDLKLENILLDKYGHIKLTDFGLCKADMPYGRRTKTFCGTIPYLAPEVLEYKESGRAVDWWSVGVVGYEMLFGEFPFCGDDNMTILFAMIQVADVKYPRYISAEAKDLLSGLLVKDPTERLGSGPDDAKPIMDHPFFSSINWKNLELKRIPPPFQPVLVSDSDTSYFHSDYTSQSTQLTPPDNSGYLEPMNFPDFSFEVELS